MRNRFKKRPSKASVHDAFALAIRAATPKGHTPTIKHLADTLLVSVSAVKLVMYGYRPVPADWCPVIERVTSHRVLCETLRPDVEWNVVLQRLKKVIP